MGKIRFSVDKSDLPMIVISYFYLIFVTPQSPEGWMAFLIIDIYCTLLMSFW